MTYASPMSRLCIAGQHTACTDSSCACGHHIVIPVDGSRPGNLARHQIIDRLNRAVDQLDDLAAFLVHLAESQGIDPMQMQYPDGQSAMAPIVTAQAQVLAALAQLEASR